MDEMRQERGPLQERRGEDRQENREEIPRQIYRPRQPEEGTGNSGQGRQSERAAGAEPGAAIGQENVPGQQAPANPYQSSQKETAQQKGDRFRLLALPTLLYAAVYTFLLYDNWASVTMPLFVAATAVYVFYIMKNGIKFIKISFHNSLRLQKNLRKKKQAKIILKIKMGALTIWAPIFVKMIKF